MSTVLEAQDPHPQEILHGLVVDLEGGGGGASVGGEKGQPSSGLVALDLPLLVVGEDVQDRVGRPGLLNAHIALAHVKFIVRHRGAHPQIPIDADQRVVAFVSDVVFLASGIELAVDQGRGKLPLLSM